MKSGSPLCSDSRTLGLDLNREQRHHLSQRVSPCGGGGHLAAGGSVCVCVKDKGTSITELGC